MENYTYDGQPRVDAGSYQLSRRTHKNESFTSQSGPIEAFCVELMGLMVNSAYKGVSKGYEAMKNYAFPPKNEPKGLSKDQSESPEKEPSQRLDSLILN